MLTGKLVFTSLLNTNNMEVTNEEDELLVVDNSSKQEEYRFNKDKHDELSNLILSDDLLFSRADYGNEPYELLINARVLQSNSGVSFLAKYQQQNIRGNEAVYEYLDDEYTDLMFRDKFFHVGAKEIAVSQAIYEGETDAMQDFTALNKANIVYTGYIFQSLKEVYDLQLGKDISDFQNYTLSYSNNLVSIRIEVVDGDIDYVLYKDGSALLELANKEAYPFVQPKRMAKFKLDKGVLNKLVVDKTLLEKNSLKEDFENNFLKFREMTGFFRNMDEVRKAHPNKDFEWIDSMVEQGKLQVVTPENFEEIMEIIRDADYLAVDTETRGLTPNVESARKGNSTIVGLVVSTRSDNGFYFPLEHSNKSDLVNLPTGQVGYSNVPQDEFYEKRTKPIEDWLHKYFKEILETKKIICHYSAFDWRVLWIYGISMNVVFDTLVAFNLTLKEAGKIFKTSLKDLAKTIFNRDSIEIDELRIDGLYSKDMEDTFADIPSELCNYYASIDGANTYSLFEWIVKNKLLQTFEMEDVFRIDVQFQKAIAYQMFYGMRLDMAQAEQILHESNANKEKYYKQFVEELEKLGGSVAESPSGTMNVESPRDLVYAFYKVAKVKPEFKTATGNLSCNKSAIDAWVNQYDKDSNPVYPLAHLFKKLNDESTLLKSFLSTYKEYCNEDGVFFVESVRDLTTGRISVANPNYQSFSDTVKKGIIARDNYMIFDYDYSSIESRVIAFMSGQTDLNDAMKDPNTDWHRIQASRMFNIHYELVTSKQRKAVKPINFGLPYGMSEFGLSARMFGDTSEANRAKARQMIKEYFAPQPKVEEFFNIRRQFAIRNGYSKTLFGRRRYYDSDKNTRSQIARQGGNAPIQGSAADIYKLGVGKLFREIEKRGWLGKVLISAFVHDEAVLEVSKDIDFGEFFTMAVNTLEFRWDERGYCPCFIGCGFGKTWYEAKSTEIPVELQYILRDNPDELRKMNEKIQDTHKMNEWLKKRIDKFNIKYVLDYLVDSKNTEQIVPSVVTGRLVDSLLAMGVGKDDISNMGFHKQVEVFCDKVKGVLKRKDGEDLVIEPVKLYTAEEYNELFGKKEEKEEGSKYQLDEDKSEFERLLEVRIEKVKKFGFDLEVDVFTDEEEGLMMDKNIYISKGIFNYIKSNPDLLDANDEGYTIYVLCKDNRFAKVKGNKTLKSSALDKLSSLVF